MFKYIVTYNQGFPVSVTLTENEKYKASLLNEKKNKQKDETYIEASGRTIYGRPFRKQIKYHIFDWETPVKERLLHAVICINPDKVHNYQKIHVLSNQTDHALTAGEAALLFPNSIERIVKAIVAVDKEYASNSRISYEPILMDPLYQSILTKLLKP